jgi:hypothetical protein
MKKILLIIVLALVVFLVYKFAFKNERTKNVEAKPIAVSKHSEMFNESVENVMNAYYAMSAGLVNWDSIEVNKQTEVLQKALADLKLDELKKDSDIYQTALFPWETAKQNVAGILSSPSLADKRRAFQDLSDNLRQLLITVKYDRNVAYWQECPMAFGEGQSGDWLSAKEEVENPYLGRKHPQYGDSMVHCGETKMKIDFTVADTAVKKNTTP